MRINSSKSLFESFQEELVKEDLIESMKSEKNVCVKSNKKEVKEQDTSFRIAQSKVNDRDYSILDITELEQKSDGDVRPPMVDISELLVEAHNSINESCGYDAININILSSRCSESNNTSNALFELRTDNKNYLMSMITEGCKVLKVNNTLGKTVYQESSENLSESVKKYFEQFLPESKEETLKDVILKKLSEPGYDELKYRFDTLLVSTKSLKKNDKDYDFYFRILQKGIYGILPELPSDCLKPVEPSDDEKQELHIHGYDKFVEEVFGKEWVQVPEETEKEPEGITPIKESVKFRIITEDEEVSTEDEVIDKDDESTDSELPDDTEKGLGVGSNTFIRKPKDLEDIRVSLKDGTTEGKSSYVICDKVKLSADEFDDLCSDLTKSQSFLPSKTVDEENFAFNVVEVSGEGTTKLLIDSAGFDYPRYVAIEE